MTFLARFGQGFPSDPNSTCNFHNRLHCKPNERVFGHLFRNLGAKKLSFLRNFGFVPESFGGVHFTCIAFHKTAIIKSNRLVPVSFFD